MEYYLTTAQAAKFVAACSPESAKNILEDLGVVPIDFGPGRGRGLRWQKDEIIIAMDKRRFGKKAVSPPKKPIAWTREIMVAAVHGRTQT